MPASAPVAMQWHVLVHPVVGGHLLSGLPVISSLRISSRRSTCSVAAGGQIDLRVLPVPLLTPICLTQCGTVETFHVSAQWAGDRHSLADSTAKECAEMLRSAFPAAAVHSSVEPVLPLAQPATFVGLSVVARTSAGCVFGGNALDSSKKGGTPAKLAREACKPVLSACHAGACVDEHLADQCIIFMALADGTSLVRSTQIVLCSTLQYRGWRTDRLWGGARVSSAGGLLSRTESSDSARCASRARPLHGPIVNCGSDHARRCSGRASAEPPLAAGAHSRADGAHAHSHALRDGLHGRAVRGARCRREPRRD